jgi:hypothetical protein
MNADGREQQVGECHRCHDDHRRDDEGRMRAAGGGAVAGAGAQPVGHDGTGEASRRQRGTVPDARAAARPPQCGAPLGRCQAGQQVDNGVPTLSFHADV